MKTKKRLSALIALILVIALSVSGAVISNVQASAYDIFFYEDLLRDEEYLAAMWEELIEEFGEEYLNNYGQALIEQGELLSLFANSSPISRFAAQSDDETAYPDFFGGFYYADDGNLVLQIVEDTSLRSCIQYNITRDFLSETSNIIVEYVEFSYNDLRAVMDYLVEQIIPDDRPDVFDNISGIGLDEMNNGIEIHLLVYNEEEVARFRNEILDSPMITLVQSVGESRRTRNINPGSRVNEIGATAGFRAETGGCSSSQGFVTAGHAVRDGQTIPNVGRVNRFRFHNNSRVDAAWIETQSHINLTNHLVGTSFGGLSTQAPVRPTANMIVRVTGGVSSPNGSRQGTVRNASYVFICPPRPIGCCGFRNPDQVSTNNLTAQRGDSGGIVWTPMPLTNADGTAIGIVLGISEGRLIFSRADLILNYFGLTRF